MGWDREEDSWKEEKGERRRLDRKGERLMEDQLERMVKEV